MFQQTLPEIPRNRNLLAEQPYQVRYPKPGENLELIHWHTDYDRGVYGLVKKKFLRRYWQLVLRRHPTAEIRALWHVDEIVHPDYETALQYAKEQVRHQWWSFQSQVHIGLKQMCDNGQELPHGIKPCTDFKRAADQEPSVFYDKEHTYCVNCNDKFVFPKGLLEKMFWKNAYKPLGPDETKVTKRYVYKRRIWPIVQRAHTKRKVIAALEKFGDHSDGVGISVVDPAYPPTEVKFFFHGKKMEVPQLLKDMMKKSRADLRRQEKVERLKAETQRQARNTEYSDTVRRLLK